MRIQQFFVLLACSAFIQGNGFFVLISAEVKNQTPYLLDVFCQVTRPSPDCYGEGCVWSSWPKTKIAPGETAPVEFWITRDDQSRMIISLMSALEDDNQLADQHLINQLQSGNHYLGEVALEYSVVEDGLFITQKSNNVQSNISATYSGFQMDLTISG